MAKLSLKHIYKIYANGTKAVNDFNLEIGDDEFIVFVGPSGCGKSTTLRMIAGLEDITAGDFLIDGVLANQKEPKDRDMAMVFQNYALYPHMTVYDNMAFGLKIRHVPKDEIDERVHKAAKILDIEDQLYKKPKEMSGGQRQRVALGRAIVRQPKVFLLDEPLSNLDAKLRSSMRAEITRLHNILKTTFIYVTHDQVEAMTMGTRIVVMSKGVMQQVDTPMNLYDYPANLFVAGFIGTPQMNFISGKLSLLNNDNIGICIGESTLVCPISTVKKLDLINAYLEKKVTLGIRPEHIRISKEKEVNSIEMNITIIEALGNESNLILENSLGEKLVVKTLRNDTLRVGDSIFVNIDLDKMHIFDKESTNTLLPRIPTKTTVLGEYLNDEVTLLGNKVKLPEPIINKLNELSTNNKLYVSIPSSSIKEGDTFTLPIIEKQQIGKKWVNILSYNNEHLFYVTDEYYFGDSLSFDVDFSEIEIFNTNLEKIGKLNKVNTVNGSLIPTIKTITFINDRMGSEEEFAELERIAIEKDDFIPKLRRKTMKVFN